MRFTLHDNGHLLAIRLGETSVYVDHRGRCKVTRWPPETSVEQLELVRAAVDALPEIREAYVSVAGRRVFGCPRSPERLAMMKYYAAALNRRLVDVAILEKGAA